MTREQQDVEEVDVVVVGAGLSGIGAACHLRRDCPEQSVVVLEARTQLGGTWDLFRYPGVRSDSDMFTLGYALRPWRGATAIARGADILAYLQDTARAYGVDRQIRTGHRAVRAEWSSERQRWRLAVQRPGGETVLSCAFLWLCTGYYRYDHGHLPDLPGREEFAGRLVHPQHWPADLDPAGARMVVIGSGATAVTLVPALAAQGAAVTMVQRSPSYLASVRADDPLVRRLSGRVPTRLLTGVVRARNVAVQTGVVALSRHRPETVRRALLRRVTRRLPVGYDVGTHFTPHYPPWDQRLCIVPDGDLFAALRSGQVDVVTEAVQGLTVDGVRLASGRELPADVVVTATGLELLAFGGLRLAIDGREVDQGRTLAYKGLMLAGVPNLAFTVGYASASWTLRADLVAGWVTRLLRRMRRRGLAVVTPEPPSDDVGPEPRRPLIGLNSGYVRRGAGRLPQQGTRRPWVLPQNHLVSVALLRLGRQTDGLRFARADDGRPDRGG